MSRPYANRPFPLSFYEQPKAAARHFLCFWCLCNEFDPDPDGWIATDRHEFLKRLVKCMPIQAHNPTLILETLHHMGYVELERLHLDTSNLATTSHYRVRVRPDAWDDTDSARAVGAVKRNVKDRKDYYRNRYLERKLKAEKEKEV